MTRRKFLQMAGGFGVSVGISSAMAVGYATRIAPLRVFMEERLIRIPSLPTAFEGFKIALFITLQRARDSIYLAGIDSAWGGKPSPSAAFANRRGDLTSIVAVHEPDYILDLVPRFPVNLQLSGHSHGGQVRLPAMGPLLLPPMGEVYNMGLYRVGNAQVYTTRGIGTIHVNVRFNCPPEVTAITLQV